jgi:hypothetical protein
MTPIGLSPKTVLVALTPLSQLLVFKVVTIESLYANPLATLTLLRARPRGVRQYLEMRISPEDSVVDIEHYPRRHCL